MRFVPQEKVVKDTNQTSKLVELTKEFKFEAAHRLTNVAPEHKCGRLHGHSFIVEISVMGDVDPSSGWLIDFGDISKVVRPIIDDELDHRYLNEIEGMDNPTSENIAIWLWNRIKPSLPVLSAVMVQETATARAIYRG